MASSSPTPSLTPSIGSSPPPGIPVQPDHFYDGQPIHATPDSDGKTWLDPDDDRLASRGIPVFKPTMDEFRDFEAYMNSVEPWGKCSGIIKVIPPKEWKDSLPPLGDQLSTVEIRTPIEQHMLGQAGLFRQQNFEKRKTMSVREWAELCGQGEFRAPGVGEVGLHARANVKAKTRARTRKAATPKTDTVEEEQVHIKEEPLDDVHENSITDEPKLKGRRQPQTKQSKEAKLAERAGKDDAFLESFDPHTHWLPPDTKPEDYTPEFCAKLERQYWRNCGLGKPPWYGADTQGSLYTDETKEWNVAHLESELSRLLPSSDGLPGVNTPYLYWGMWRATFAWHVEDMDLFSINYIHFGAPKFWYAVPQGRASTLERAMRSFFPKDTSQCHQFLRHKSFLASPTLLAKSSCKPNHCVQHAGEFMITFPRGYHAGFNLGLNCAESVNFALSSWLELGKVAKACECIPDSVRIDVNKLLEERERGEEPSKKKLTVLPKVGDKRKSDGSSEESSKRKKPKKSLDDLPSKHIPIKITLKLGPRPTESDIFPCCLCVSMNKEGLLRVQDPPVNRKDALDACGYPRGWVWMAHKDCATIVPETWVDEAENLETGLKEEVVFGVDGIVRDRWNLKCTACTKTRPKAHGAPIQCTKGKCPKAFHISCARDVKDNNVVFNILKEVEKEVVLVNSNPPANDSIHLSALQPGSESDRMQTDSSTEDAQDGDSSTEVLKVIKKYEVQVFCTQHNPTMAARKKASKQDKIKQDLLALPPMSRVKVRVSAGVFEVSLIRVIEETNSVEVLWDRGSKREFKWGSVVFGNTEGPVQSKPSEVAPPEESFPTTHPDTIATATTHPSVPHPQSTTSSASVPAPTTSTYGHYPAAGYSGYPYWTYPAQASYGQGSHGYGYGTYYPGAIPVAPQSATAPSSGPSTSNITYTTPPPQYSKFPSTTPAAPSDQPNVKKYYRNRELQWKTPYQPAAAHEPQIQPEQKTTKYQFSVPLVSATFGPQSQSPNLMDSLHPPSPPIGTNEPSSRPTADVATLGEAPLPQSQHGDSDDQTLAPPNDITAILSSLTTEQLSGLIQTNPELRTLVLNVIGTNSTP